MTNNTELQSRLDFIGLDQVARDRLGAVQHHINEHLPAALSNFYDKIRAVPAVATFFDGRPQMDRAQSKQLGHWKAIATGSFDDAYYEASTRVGLRHAQIGLEPRWHIGGYGVIMETLVRGLVHDLMAEALTPEQGRFGMAKPLSRDEVLNQADAMALALSDMLKAMLLDIDIGVSAYFEKLSTEARTSDENAKARINRAVTLTGDVLKNMAQGDLTTRITADFDPEFQQIKDDTNAVAEKLTGIVNQLQHTSRSLKTATAEIMSGANDLSNRTARQATTVESTSASIRQLTETVSGNARLASTANEKAQAVSTNATRGGHVMKEASDAMIAIEASSGKISNIIGLIDDIAFQTNLLALNASVEAARAGDAGKGFAVVAIEVRRLAQSAASASDEIKGLIEASAGEVQSGSRLVEQAANVLQEIVAGAQESASLINSIAEASKQQSDALGEVASAIHQIDEITQHNAALVTETNAAIEQTEGEAAELDRIVDVFKVDQAETLDGIREPARQRRVA
jgi:methyl-accepting chemotaxis protein